SLLPHASGAVIVGVRIKQLLAIDLVVGDRFLSFGRHQPVDELLPEVFLDVRMLFRKSIRTSRKTSGSNSSTGWCRPKDRKRSPTTRSMASSCFIRTPTITAPDACGSNDIGDACHDGTGGGRHDPVVRRRQPQGCVDRRGQGL